MNNIILKGGFVFSTVVLVLALSFQNGVQFENTHNISVTTQGENKGDDTIAMKIANAYGKVPMGFEENIGQTDEQVKFMTRGQGYSLFLTPTEAVLALSKQPAKQDDANKVLPVVAEKMAVPTESRVLRMAMLGANRSPRMAGLEMQSGKSNYIRGNDQSQWHTGVNRYGRVLYDEVYAGVDLAFYGNQKQLEYDFIVKPGTSPDSIRIKFAGADSMEVDADGNLVLHLGDAQVVQHAPVIYQELDGKRQPVEGGYVLAANNEVAFEVASYNTGTELIIDPVLVYSTYLGGNSKDIGRAIAVDASGNAYVSGETVSTNFPVLNAVQATFGGNIDAFVTKLDATGALAYSTYLGGNSKDYGYGIAVDASGNAYVTGVTYSTDFPILNAVQATYGGGISDAFVTKLNATGALVFSTYFGGNDRDSGGSIAVDTSSNAYVFGNTSSSNFPTLNAFQTTMAGSFDAFITKLDASGALAYSTYLGGISDDYATAGIAVDASGNAYVGGSTLSTNFPILNAVQATHGGSMDVYITKLDATGALVYSTYLGGSINDGGFGIAVDASGNAYVSGYTYSTNFPILNAVQATMAGVYDAFVTKLDATGALAYSTYLGGNSYDLGDGIAVDASGNAYVSGYTYSTNFPILNAVQATYGGSIDAFVTKLDATGALAYSTYLGGSNEDSSSGGIAVDASGNVYVTGYTYSTNFPTLNAFQATMAGWYDVFVTKISASNQPPMANAGADQNIFLTLTAFLDGSGSSDPEEAALSHLWAIDSAPAGSTAVLSCTTCVSPSLTPDVASPPAYVMSLVVNDGLLDSAAATVSISATENLPPDALAAGSPLTGLLPLAVSFTAGASSDPETGPLTYNWAFGDPASGVDNASSLMEPNHTYNAAGTYTAAVTVMDDFNQTDQASVEIEVTAPNLPPTVAPTATPSSGAAPLAVQFSANASDEDVNLLSYNWDFGDSGTSSDANPLHSYAVAGTYTATVEVSDGVNPPVVSSDLVISVDSPLSITVTESKVDYGKKGKVKGKISLKGDFTYPGMPDPSDVIRVIFDGITLLEAPSSSFEEESEHPGVYEYESTNVHAKVDFNKHTIKVSRHKMLLTGLDVSNGIDVVVYFGVHSASDHFAPKVKVKKHHDHDDHDEDDGKEMSHKKPHDKD